MPTRAQYYTLIHMGAARLGYQDEADYRAWLESLTGKRSAKECTLAELAGLATTLRACHALDNPRIKAIKGGRGQGERPTEAQWGLIDGLCRQLGMTGCTDARFIAFAKRNAHVDHPRFLTLTQAQKLIAALQIWLAKRQTEAGRQ